jgi:hypothetical protein
MTSERQISNAKKGNNFPLDNCFNKRVLFFNEPRFEPSFYETLLMLFAGDPMSEQAKFRSVCEIVRTPVIVTANSSAFPTEKRWNCRMFRYTWKECELLNDLQHRPAGRPAKDLKAETCAKRKSTSLCLSSHSCVLTHRCALKQTPYSITGIHLR